MGHTLYSDKWVTTKNETCTEKGEQTQNCAICGETIKLVIEPGHKFGEWEVVKAATADENGEKKRTCKRCGDTETETIPKKGSAEGGQ